MEYKKQPLKSAALLTEQPIARRKNLRLTFPGVLMPSKTTIKLSPRFAPGLRSLVLVRLLE
jgi:hypothetical protein